MTGPRASGNRVWITRAQPGADRTATNLTILGFQPIVAPLLRIEPLAIDPDLSGITALAFTSGNAVTAFAALTSRRDWPAFTVGDATADIARAAGFADVRSANGAVADLVNLIAASRSPDDGPVLAPGAREPAADLAAALAGRVAVRTLPVYQATETGTAPPAAFDIVLTQSPRAARALAGCLSPETARSCVLVAISPAAAAPLSALDFAEIRIATVPTGAALIAALGNPVRPV
ncbi:uroporphyrinogen-III synthase [uncultured Brevundimonas sp.]|uniref:uroporphyrinogen-III synthase n=1 Tax=uncultured Brevundimonas sp. TaxID=213418 RepID=UPI0030EEC7D5|tara:strand:+ start:136564 stop:137265 length:702 start_codon:yes stop_codon:yes gene_type:complete